MIQRFVKPLLLAVLLLVAAGAQADTGAGADAGGIRMRADATCGGPEYRVADLITGAIAPELADRVVGRSPAPGTSRQLSRRRLERMLAGWGWRGGLSGPEWLRLSSPGVELDTAVLLRRVEARLDTLLAERGLSRQGQLSGWPAKLVLSTSRLRWELELEEGRKMARAAARVVLTDRAGFEARISLRFRCKRLAQVVVAAADLGAGRELVSWRMEERDLFTVDGRPLVASELTGAVARRAVKPGETLTTRNMKPAVLVRAGREVEVRVLRGAVSVSLTGIAQRDGSLGDVIAVRHLEGRTLRRYRVTGPGTVAPAYLERTGDRS